MSLEQEQADLMAPRARLGRGLILVALTLLAAYGLASGLLAAVTRHAERHGTRAVPDGVAAGRPLPRGASRSAGLKAGVVMAGARKMLADEWSDGEDHAERAWCVTEYWAAPFWRKRPTGAATADTLYRVFTVVPAETRSASTHSVEASCAPGQPVMHSHPITDGAADCNPSGPDYDRLHERGDPFGVIWCDRRAFRFYYPSDMTAR